MSGRCSMCSAPVAGPRCEVCEGRMAGAATLHETLQRLMLPLEPITLRPSSPTRSVPSTNAPRCVSCGDLGPCARLDGARYDSAGALFPCPDCGVSTSLVQAAAALDCHPADLVGVR